MTTFVTSDLHFNHKNIVVYQPNRGTTDLDYMNEIIIKNWNEDVQPEDEVFILGDVAMGLIEKAPALIRRLNGTKQLVLGNHDRSLERMMIAKPEHRSMFDRVEQYREVTFSVDDAKTMVVMSHFPMAHWNGQANGNIMLHGHLHGAHCDVPGRIMDVGMDTNNMRPYRMDDVIRAMRMIEVRGNHHGD